MTEQHFASIYDLLMEDVPYEEWLNFTRKFVSTGAKVLDLACGTGTLAIKFYEAGFNVTGVDISQDMLAVAEKKIREKQIPVRLFNGDMRNLSGFSDMDAVTIFCDGVNYLLEEQDVQRTFSEVAKTLQPGGVFLFDVHSIYKMETIFNDQLYGENGEEISYLWFSSPGEKKYSVDHTLTFFIKEQEGVYNRMDEEHSQRTFPVETYMTWLKDAGFNFIEVYSDFGKEAPRKTDERYFFKAIKNKQEF
ncbi:ubiquinone/menaquinone biosynthesis C-methylase UbiE [Evansella vedderi]|uniref:Ubiquinone/menaquinone biosynthesis C-methylase UbiE n=1 Tax=Evansella vedderi TaxID=38282 RepID=A0ABT9ZSW3_9BACI|nr:class I SAM-dependent methyltransferase [Evansella vedderi]MDQ0254327.1 ubiquinone/menaquinone biosynthesis C-methylase UbiE [Evansella vedderi]